MGRSLLHHAILSARVSARFVRNITSRENTKGDTMIMGLKKSRAKRKKEAKEGIETALVRWGFCWRLERRIKKGGEKE